MNNIAHLFKANNDQNEALAAAFNQRVLCINTIKLLCQLTQTVQQHRAASMGYLSGEQSFMPLIESLQGNIDRLLSILSFSKPTTQAIIAAELLANIQGDWKTILIGWQDDHIINNYEFHCHLIAVLNKVLKNCMKQSLLPTLQQSQISHGRLLETFFVQLPDFIEHLGMLRALSINAAVVQSCGSDSHKRLSFLLRDIEGRNSKLMASFNNLLPDYPTIASIHTVKENQQGLQRFLLSIQMNILECSSITTDSTGLYALSTEIINSHWLAIEQGIQLVEKLIYNGLIEQP